MREIKFRAWNSDYKEMWEWTDIKASTPFRLIEEAKNIIFLQYTGLKDKNGKEIYEGDILEDFINNKRYEVIWDNYGMFLFNPIGTEGNGIDYYEFEDEASSATIIIGNIYENPELLEL